MQGGAQEPLIRFDDVSFQYEGQDKRSLQNVDITIDAGELVLVTGESGSGKTTLTRCVNCLIPHFFRGELSGEVLVGGRSIKETTPGDAGKLVASIFQDPRSQFFTTSSDGEAAFACENYGVAHEEIVRRVDDSFATLGMGDLKGKSIFSLSSGQRQKVAFIAAATLNPGIYVLDEPTANLDSATVLQVRDVLAALKEAGHTIVVSEHRLFWLAGLVDHIIVMRQGRVIEDSAGSYMELMTADALHDKQLRAFDLGSLRHASPPAPPCRGDAFLRASHVRFSYRGEPLLLDDVSLSAWKGEVIALIGRNGSGKTTLGKVLAGLIPCRDGRFIVAGSQVRQKRLSDYAYFVMQEADHQLYKESAVEELRLGNERASDIDERIAGILDMLNLTDFAQHHPYALSGGQKQRLTIGTAMASSKPIVVLDEPTSGLDWGNMCAVAQAINQLRESGRLVFVITHDIELVDLTATRVLALAEGRIADNFPLSSQAALERTRQIMLGGGLL